MDTQYKPNERVQVNYNHRGDDTEEVARKVNAEYMLPKKAKPPDRDTSNTEPSDSSYVALMLAKGDKRQKEVDKGNDGEINEPTGSCGDHCLQEMFSDQAQERFFPDWGGRLMQPHALQFVATGGIRLLVHWGLLE